MKTLFKIVLVLVLVLVLAPFGQAQIARESAYFRGLKSAASEAALKAALNAEAGVDFMGYDPDLATWAGITPSANGQSLVSAANYAAMRALMDLEAGTDFNAYSANLATLAGITYSANVQSLLGAADYSAMRTLLSLVPGADVQAFDADLTDLADGSLTGSKVGTGIDAANVTTGTLPDARLSAAVTLDADFDTDAEKDTLGFVNKAGTQTVAGTKTFSDIIAQRTRWVIQNLGNQTGTVSVPWTTNDYRLVATGNVVFTPTGSAPSADQGQGIGLWFKQDGVGGRTLTVGGSSVSVNATADAETYVQIITRDGGSTVRALTDYVTGSAAPTIVFPLTIDNAANSMDYTVAFVPAAFTVSQVRIVHSGSGLSSPDIDVQVRHSTDRSAAGNLVDNTAFTVTSSTSGDSFTSGFEDATVPANSWIWIETSSISGTTDDLNVIIIGTYD
jgi:hypothetical protein